MKANIIKTYQTSNLLNVKELKNIYENIRWNDTYSLNDLLEILEELKYEEIKLSVQFKNMNINGTYWLKLSNKHYEINEAISKHPIYRRYKRIVELRNKITNK